MLANIRMTVQESIRYRGRYGHYSWLLHRVTGLGILFFLLLHVWDGTLATFNPRMYQWTITVFKNPIFGLGEIAVFGCVLYHAFNGIRITILDYWPQLWHQQDTAAKIVWGLFLILFIPLGAMMLIGTIEHCSHTLTWPDGTTGSCWSIPPLDAYIGGN